MARASLYCAEAARPAASKRFAGGIGDQVQVKEILRLIHRSIPALWSDVDKATGFPPGLSARLYQNPVCPQLKAQRLLIQPAWRSLGIILTGRCRRHAVTQLRVTLPIEITRVFQISPLSPLFAMHKKPPVLRRGFRQPDWAQAAITDSNRVIEIRRFLYKRLSLKRGLWERPSQGIEAE